GDGRLALAVLDALRDEYPGLYAQVRYMSAESSPLHRKLQQERLAAHGEKVEAIAAPGDERLARALAERPALVFANELLDAFPVHLLVSRRSGWREIYVEQEEGSGFALRETEGPLSSGKLESWLAAHPIHA